MAHQRINIDPSLSMGNALLEAVDWLAKAKGQLNRLNKNNVPMVDGSDYSRLAQEYGCDVGDAQDLYNLIAGTIAELDIVNDTYLLQARTDQG